MIIYCSKKQITAFTAREKYLCEIRMDMSDERLHFFPKKM